MRKRNVTIKDIAREAGVSHPVVSAILGKSKTTSAFSEKTRKRVEEVAVKLGYHPDIFARSLRCDKSFLVGILGYEVNSPGFSPFLKGVQNKLFPAGYAPMLLTHRASAQEKDNLQRLLKRKVDALMVNTTLVNDSVECFGLYDSLIEDGFPIVEILGKYLPKVPKVNIDFVQNAFKATKYLLERGHSRLAMVTHGRYDLPSRGSGSHFDAWEVFQGCCGAVGEAGASLEVVTHPIGDTEFVTPEEWVAGGRFAGERILDGKIATAAVCYDDYEAVGLLQRLSELDSDFRSGFEVVSTKSNPICHLMEPSIVGVEISMEKIGAVAADTVLRLLEGRVASSFSLAGELF